MPKLKPGQPQAPERPHPTIGYNEPTKDMRGTGRGKQGCLCLNRNYYSLKCCQGYLSQQGVGLIYGPKVDNVFIEPSNP
jgi:hypothetical protein